MNKCDKLGKKHINIMDTASYRRDDEGISLNTVEEKHEVKGLNVWTTCVFVVGVIAGSGFLTLPKAIEDSGLIGFLLVVLCCFVSAYTGDILGKCWTIVRDRHPEFRNGKVRYPYPAIGEEAFGKWGSAVISCSINFTMFGTTVVYILLAAGNIVELLPADSKWTCCYISLIIWGVMTPFTWLGTPKDFWGIAAGATLATTTASFILFGVVINYSKEIDVSDVKHTHVDVISFFTAYGTICFAYNGHPAFPTFQSDMANPRKFGRALALGYFIVFVIYMPCSIATYVVYGETIEANILSSVASGPATTIVSVLMTAHLLFGIVIVINPVSQQLEHVLNIPETFTWKRILSRTLTMLAVLFVVESVPHFSSILSLVGGSTISILAFICPPLFYLKLCRGDGM